MGSNEEAKPSKAEKPSSPVTDQNNSVHVYPDWAAMQAFYGPRFAVPPYMNSGVASPHAPVPYMWGPPQSMMPPYGPPYAAFYAHGGVYAHPGVPVASTALSMETPVKSPGNADGGFVKKLKEFDGLAMSIGNGNGDSTEHDTDRRLSDSEETDGSSDGSNGVTPRAGQNGKKRSRQGSPSSGDGKANKKSNLVTAVEVGEKTTDVIPSAVKTMENTNTALELNDPSQNVKSSPTNAPQPLMQNVSWPQNDRELKRERRKQSNRESARRSRLRKQAETEELAVKVQALTTENMTLKAEINKLMESSEHLKLENTALAEKLRGAQVEQTEEANLHKIDELRMKPVGTVNLLARVNNNSDGEPKLHQLLDSNPRTDAVAAG
ncbi:hypothetical protein ABFX02_02G172400 [Erythranthe guttata]